jgi:aromatic ring-opening dioxygenase catalytic subunit (LigB family)
MGMLTVKREGCTILTGAGLTPVHFFSHGSTMMLGEESTSGDYWKKCGDEALAHGIKGVVMMVSFA